MSCHVPWWIIIVQLQSYSFYKGMCVCKTSSPRPHSPPPHPASSFFSMALGHISYWVGCSLYKKSERYIPAFPPILNHEVQWLLICYQKDHRRNLEVPAIQFKAKVIPTTSSLKGFVEEISIIRVAVVIFLSSPKGTALNKSSS